jgi:hypothetical protein
LEFTVDIQYTREQFQFRWDWRSDRLYVAEIGMADSKKFTPIPNDVRDFPKWMRTLEHEAAEIQMTIKNDQKKTESYSLYSVFLMGKRWKPDVEMWLKPDWAKFNLADVQINSEFSSEEDEFMKEEWKKHLFKNCDLHRSVQRQFLGLLRVAVQEHPDVNRRMDGVFRRISPLDFLQGSRALVALREVINEVIASEIPDLQNLALGLGKEIVADEHLSYDELSSKIDELEKVVELLKYGGHTGAERLLVQQFVHHGRSHKVPAVAQAMSVVYKKGTFTIEVLREAVKDHVPAPIRSGGADTYMARAMSAVAAFLRKGEQALLRSSSPCPVAPLVPPAPLAPPARAAWHPLATLVRPALPAQMP